MKNVEPVIKKVPNLDPFNEKAKEMGIRNLGVNICRSENGPVKLGWCIFESNSDWNADKIKKWQDEDKKAWSTQEVWEITKPPGVKPMFS